ncbi:hypothetical protein [Flavobacterium caseinilyticum]|jgi:hypothetical protein|uniref:Uncharacterized protein n=1 Tax=Flavobacterium caseinilyticum TaxID=2541732 RepID=A0A4R5AXY1_9FLAO|nr:hypothetical protein [Flavobacterium caseinilyticum]TDD78408.1 hypothetical protein E0F89_01880 [Flavobacterium caseinilyticum]
MNNILEDLKKYFQDTPQEQIMKDWAETEKFDKVGPSIEEFLTKTKLYFKLEEEKLLLSQPNFLDNIKNPKYSSGFSLH